MSIEKIIEEFAQPLGIFNGSQYINVQKDFLLERLRTSLEEYGRERFEAGFKIGLTEDNNLK